MNDVEVWARRLGTAAGSLLRARADSRRAKSEPAPLLAQTRAPCQTRLPLALALSAAGAADATYLLLFQTGVVRHLWCPFFGPDCERISGSRIAHPFGIPDAIFGVAGYAVLFGLAARAGGGDRLAVYCVQASAGAAAIAATTSVFLTWAQWRLFRGFCFWCLLSAGLSLALVPATLPAALASLQSRQ